MMMMKLTDYHTHTPLCQHAEGSPEQFITAALAAQLTEYGIADHAPMPPELEPFDNWRMDFSQMPQYLAWIDEVRALAPASLTIRAGLECDWFPDIEKWTHALENIYPWDYLIGSIHYLDKKWDFDNPLWIPKWKNVNVEEVWTDFWNMVVAMADSGLYDILGHIDLIKKFGFVPRGNLNRFYSPAIEAIRAHGTAIEINTSGWHKPCQEAYPTLQFLKLAHHAEIPLCINSDAHAPEEIGRNFTLAYKLAYEAGYRKLVTFAQREKHFHPLILS